MSLSASQRARLDEWLPGAVVERDHSWGQVERDVLELLHVGDRFIVKAGGGADHHIRREIRAHTEWLEPWTSIGCAPVLVHADAAANILVTRHLPGELGLGTAYADEPETYRQAGCLLVALHAQLAVTDPELEERENRHVLEWLDRPHRIEPDAEDALRAAITSWPTPPARLVPTHGDWQPRNWLVDGGVVRIIDFGRADLRPAMSDFARLAAQDFARDVSLEEAFIEGYGDDPREPEAWLRNRVREAVGTATWAHQVGDTEFEAQGHRMIAEVLKEVRN